MDLHKLTLDSQNNVSLNMQAESIIFVTFSKS